MRTAYIGTMQFTNIKGHMLLFHVVIKAKATVLCCAVTWYFEGKNTAVSTALAEINAQSASNTARRAMNTLGMLQTFQ